MIGVWSNYLSPTNFLHRYQTWLTGEVEELYMMRRLAITVMVFGNWVFENVLCRLVMWWLQQLDIHFGCCLLWRSCLVGFQGSYVMKMAAFSGSNGKRLMVRRLKINLRMDCNNNGNNNSLILILISDLQCLQTSFITSYCIDSTRCRKWAEATQKTHEVLI